MNHFLLWRITFILQGGEKVQQDLDSLTPLCFDILTQTAVEYLCRPPNLYENAKKGRKRHQR